MKKLLAVLIISGACYSAQSQKVYVQGGVNLANITSTNDGQTEKNKMLTSFNAGIMTRIMLAKMVGIETGLLLTGQGSKAETYFTAAGTEGYVKSTFNPLYIQLPVNLLIKAPVSQHAGLFFNAGPYIAVGIGGKSKTDTYNGIATTHSESKIAFANDDPLTSEQEDANYNKLKRFDYGINLGGGISFSKILLKANYGIGLSKINSTQSNNDANDKNKYRTVSISLGIPL